MKIVKPYARLKKDRSYELLASLLPRYHADFDITAEVNKIYQDVTMGKIEWCARISHRSEEAQGEETWKRFIEAVVIGHGDWSVVEHVSATVDMLVDRGITHEIVRHRLFSFTQESTRFVNYEKKMPPSFIYPRPDVECVHCLGDNKSFEYAGRWVHNPVEDGGELLRCAYDPTWLACIRECELSYQKLIKDGWRPQEARSIFPNALASRIVMTGNLRNWRHFFLMRTSKEAHPQMRQVTIPLLVEFKTTFPLLYDDIVPESRQIDNMRLPR